MWSDKHDLNFSVPITIMRNYVKRTISYNPPCEIAENNNALLRENNISYNRQIVPVNLHFTCFDASSKHLTQLHAFEKIDQELMSDLSTLKSEIKTDKVFSQDICQDTLNKWPGYDEKNSVSLMQLTEKEDSSIEAAKILQRYFAICDTILSDDTQHPTDYERDVKLSEERNHVNDITETREKVSSLREDPISLEHKLTLILPRCNCTNSEQSEKVDKSNRRSEELNEKSEYVIISTSVTNTCWNSLLHDANNKIPEKYVIHILSKQNEEHIVFSYPDENNIYQQTSICSFCDTTAKKQTQLQSKECNRAVGLSAMEQLANELLILIRQMYHAERSMLFIGLIDVINSIEQNLAEFVILAKDATHLSVPLDFLTRLAKLAKAKSIPHIYICEKKQLGQVCCVSTDISVISIKIGPSYFSEEIKKIKYTIMSVVSKKSA